MSKMKPAKRAAEAHTNLNVWAIIVAILEASVLYGNTDQHKAAGQVIKIARSEQQKFLRAYDKAMNEVATWDKP